MTVDCVSGGADPDSGGAGELDHHRAKEVMTELDEQIDMALPPAADSGPVRPGALRTARASQY